MIRLIITSPRQSVTATENHIPKVRLDPLREIFFPPIELRRDEIISRLEISVYSQALEHEQQANALKHNITDFRLNEGQTGNTGEKTVFEFIRDIRCNDSLLYSNAAPAAILSGLTQNSWQYTFNRKDCSPMVLNRRISLPDEVGISGSRSSNPAVPLPITGDWEKIAHNFGSSADIEPLFRELNTVAWTKEQLMSFVELLSFSSPLT